MKHCDAFSSNVSILYVGMYKIYVAVSFNLKLRQPFMLILEKNTLLLSYTTKQIKSWWTYYICSFWERIYTYTSVLNSWHDIQIRSRSNPEVLLGNLINTYVHIWTGNEILTNCVTFIFLSWAYRFKAQRIALRHIDLHHLVSKPTIL